MLYNNMVQGMKTERLYTVGSTDREISKPANGWRVVETVQIFYSCLLK